MNRKNQIKKLIEQENEIARKRSNLQYKEKIEVNVPILKRSIGRCFKYHNSYGNERKRWWLYCKIVGINEKNMEFTVVAFEKTSLGNMTIDFERKYNFNGEFYFNTSHHTEITPREYRREANKMLKFTTGLLKQ